MQQNDWSKISSFKKSKESPGFLLWKTQIIWKRMIEKELSSHDLTHPQFVILASVAYLTKNNQNIAQVELARHTSCDINTTSQILRSLEKKGLIKRLSKIGNEKSKYPHLTTEGYNRLKPAIQAVEEIDQQFFSQLNLDELERFKLIVLKLSQNIEPR